MNKKLNVATIISFILILFTPLIVSLLGIDKHIKINENRNLAKLPKFDLNRAHNYPIEFANYFNDNFGLRTSLVRLNNSLKLKYLKTSTHPQVAIGKEDWLYYTPEDNYKDILNIQPLNQTDLEEIKTNLEKIDSYFNSKGAKFYFLVAPTSQTIYPEYLPDYLKKVNDKSKLDQLREYLANNSSIQFIDPSEDLKNSKDLGRLYYKHDLHWNLLGSYIASNKLIFEISKDFPLIKPKKLTEYMITYQKSPQKDLELMLGVTDFYQEEEPILKLKSGEKAKLISGDCRTIYMRCSELLTQNPDSKLPKLLMYRDSYGSWLTPFLSEYFSVAHYLWQARPYSIQELDQDKPNVVIWELTERELYALKERAFAF